MLLKDFGRGAPLLDSPKGRLCLPQRRQIGRYGALAWNLPKQEMTPNTIEKKRTFAGAVNQSAMQPQPWPAKRKEDREAALVEAQKYRQRVIDLPDPDDELLRYLPSRSVEGEESGVSQRRAEALCRRLIAVHCLYGVDKNPLAVELAKLALWLESHAEGRRRRPRSRRCFAASTPMP